MLRIAVAASGNGSNFENLIQHALNGQMPFTKIVCLIVDKKNAFVIERAKKNNIPTFIFDIKNYNNKDNFEKAIIAILEKNKIELVVLAGYMRIIGNTLLQAFANKIINIHPSYLPFFPGKNSIADAFHSGIKNSGVSIHYVNEDIDGGKIILQEQINFLENENLQDWENKIHALEYRLYPKAINKINPYL